MAPQHRPDPPRHGAAPRAAPALLAAAMAAVVTVAAAGCVVEPEAVSCPTGIYCPAGARCAARAATCIFDLCGDGVQQAGEACDDGNLDDRDGCSRDCRSDERCGNGHTDDLVGEVCDDGNTVGGDGCAADCTSLERCGDSHLDPGEDCDAGAETRGCDADCTFAQRGDGTVNASAGEACDGDGAGQGNGTDCQWQGCNANCSVSRRGDGWVNPLDGEECDGNGRGTGNGVDCRSATCNADCTPSRCGDGITNGLAGEDCDDGNASNLDDCRNDCRANVCGDGLQNRDGPLGHEECDQGAENGPSVCAYGLTSCDGCGLDCRVFVPVTHFCGDGHPDGPPIANETCDDERSFVCGTCSTSACTTRSVAAASGRITVTSTAVADGDTMTIDDGVGLPVTFELSLDATCGTVGASCIQLGTATTVEAVASEIRAALVRAGPSLAVQPEVATAGPNPIVLLNGAKGLIGNVDIEVTGLSVVVAAPGAIVVEGMSGGAGCPIDAPCFDSRDCVSGRCSKSKVCRVP